MDKVKVKEFFEFIQERQRIFERRRHGGKPPWTRDPVLQKYRFCNVRREGDAGTRHLINNVHLCKQLDLEHKILNIILFRRFNVRNFFTDILPHGAFEFYAYGTGIKPFKMLLKHLDDAKRKGLKLFSPAYTLCQKVFDPKFRPHEKHVQIALMMESLWTRGNIKSIAREPHEAEKIFANLMRYPQIGPFLAYQILVDISYLKEYADMDMDNFVYVGPGAVGTIEYIFGSCPDQSFAADKCILLHSFQHRYLPKRFPFISLPNIQNCCCEFRKYRALKTEPEKHRKRYYNV